MDSGFYAAVNGALRSEMKLEVLTNNLANVNTTGFKADDITFDSFLTAAGPEMFPMPTDSFMGLRAPGDVPFPYSNPGSNSYQMTYPMATGTQADLQQGSLQATGNPLDMAVEGEGFFMVQTPNGERFTRDGSFTVNQNGELVNKDGFPVLGEGGSSLVIGDSAIEVGPDGSIATDAGIIGRIARVSIPPEVLKKEGQNLYSAPQENVAPVESGFGGIRQGFLEGSNSDSIRGMTQMVETHRAYDTYMKMIKALDGLDGQATNQIGRLNG
ncbi:MAG: flagellar basal-body rod protein FlgF [Magnetococcales bacterium]|nr:flagellar basal-body rod protein FlgF [Magnetococcales bacterium]